MGHELVLLSGNQSKGRLSRLFESQSPYVKVLQLLGRNTGRTSSENREVSLAEPPKEDKA